MKKTKCEEFVKSSKKVTLRLAQFYLDQRSQNEEHIEGINELNQEIRVLLGQVGKRGRNGEVEEEDYDNEDRFRPSD